MLSSEVFAAIQQAPETDNHVVYASVLSQWGIMCSHPQRQRLYVGVVTSDVPLPQLKWYSCGSCGAGVINEEWQVATGGRRG